MISELLLPLGDAKTDKNKVNTKEAALVQYSYKPELHFSHLHTATAVVCLPYNSTSFCNNAIDVW